MVRRKGIKPVVVGVVEAGRTVGEDVCGAVVVVVVKRYGTSPSVEVDGVVVAGSNVGEDDGGAVVVKRCGTVPDVVVVVVKRCGTSPVVAEEVVGVVEAGKRVGEDVVGGVVDSTGGSMGTVDEY